MIERNRYTCIWDAIGTTREIAENMRRAERMNQLREHIATQSWNPSDAAHNLGVTQQRLSDLMQGRISVFSFEALSDMATKAGLV